MATYYSLDAYHIMGTRILSRSFTLENEEPDGDDDGQEEEKNHPESSADVGNTSIGSAMDVDEPNASEQHGHDHGEESEDDDGEENAQEVAMVPLAEILNARYKTENVRFGCHKLSRTKLKFVVLQVKLFHEPDCFRMISTKPIKAGEQIVRLPLSFNLRVSFVC